MTRVRQKPFPDELDYSELKWLQHGDNVRVAEKTHVSAGYVSKVRCKIVFNIDVLAELFKLARENRAKVMEIANKKPLPRG